MTSRSSLAITFLAAAALVAPERSFAAFQPASASRSAADEPSCVPPELRFPGSGAFEPWMVFFDLGSDTINSDAAVVLKNAATVFRQFPKCILLIEAHTDGMEAASYPPDLAARRANAVIRFLRERGAVMRTKVEEYGDSRPLVNRPKGAAEPQNRGVAFVMVPETYETHP